MGNDVGSARPWAEEHGDPDPARQRRLAVLHELALKQMAANPQSTERPRPSRQSRAARTRKRSHARLSMRHVMAMVGTLVVIITALAAIPAVRENGARLFGMNAGSPGRHSASPVMAYLIPDIPWTTVEVDGKQVQVPVPGKSNPIAFGPGRHRITWQAESFQLHTCMLTVPAARDDNCEFASLTPLRIPGKPAAVVLTLPVSLHDLPQSDADNLLRAITQALTTPTSTLYPGERFYNSHASPYASGSGPIFTAKQQLQVRLGMLPTYGSAGFGFGTCQFAFGGTSPTSCKIGDEDCYAICVVPWETRLADGPPSRNTWDVFIAVHLFRDFIASNGQVVMSDNALDIGQTGIFAHLVRLRIIWSDGHWNVTPVMGTGALTPVQASGGQVMYDPGCVDAEDLIAQSRPTYSTIQFISGPIPADGCLVVMKSGTGAEQERYLVRFGVPISLRPGQQFAGANVPLADAHEKQIAQQLARYSGQTFSNASG